MHSSFWHAVRGGLGIMRDAREALFADTACMRADYLAAASALIPEVLALMDSEPDTDALLRAGARSAPGLRGVARASPC